MLAPSSALVRLLGYAALLCSCVVLLASFFGRRPLLSVAVRVQLLHMHLSLSYAVDDSSFVLRPPSMLGARYYLLLCLCTHCTAISIFYKLSMTSPSYIPARPFGGCALMRSSFSLRVSVDTWHPLLTVVVLVTHWACFSFRNGCRCQLLRLG
jgi:hypothetical protein